MVRDTTVQRRGVYDLMRVNVDRAPDYVRVDIGVDRTFTVGGEPLNLFLGVQNVTNRRIFAVPLTSLAGRRRVAADPEYPDRQSEP